MSATVGVMRRQRLFGYGGRIHTRMIHRRLRKRRWYA